MLLDISETLSALEKRCRARGLPVTVQRRTVMEILATRTDHPTVDALFDEARQRLPGISRTTVYRILEALVDLDMAAKAVHPGPTVRYDARTDGHHHFFCVKCNRIFDYEDPFLGDIPVPAPPRQGFVVSRYAIYLEGVCPDCAEQNAGL
jgi:Fur family transcriptional regulator, peroxide stress response regulator